LGVRKEGQVKDALPYIRLAPMNKIGEIAHTNGVDLLAGKEDVED
jgi:hypothetical protein